MLRIWSRATRSEDKDTALLLFIISVGKKYVQFFHNSYFGFAKLNNTLITFRNVN